MTPKQEAFSQAVADGMDNSSAYRHAYNVRTTNNNTIAKKAWKIAHTPVVFARVEALKKEVSDGRLLQRVGKRVILCEIAEDKEQQAQNRIKAIEVDNRMTGDDAPQKVEVFGLTDLMRLVRGGESAD